jgi:hypothetical protein
MKRQDIWTLVTTFVVGAIAGGYVYVVGFAPQFEQLTGQTADVYENLVIEGEQYGGDGVTSLPSFQIISDGSYTYLSGAPDISSRQGTMSRTLLSDIAAVADADTLYQNSQLAIVSDCSSAIGGVDYRYDITRDGVVYTLDTCGTDFSSPDLRAALDNLWKYFRAQQ